MFSKSDNIPYVIDKLAVISKNRGVKMKILDVGCGFGKWGFLFRGWLDGEKNGPHREEWTHTIDACEVFEPYITPIHRYLFDQIILDDFRNLFRGAGKYYTLIIMGDCLEHVTLEEGKETVKRYLDYCSHLIISVPGYRDSQREKFGNPAEQHRAWWTEKDFLEVRGDCDVKRTGKLITAHYSQNS